MKKTFILLIILTILLNNFLIAQNIDPWKIVVTQDQLNQLSKEEYYGITVANGIIGIVSDKEPLKVKDVILAGTFDNYGRGRVSNFLKSINLLNMRVTIDNETISKDNITNYTQTINFKNGAFSVDFIYKNKAKISYSYYALRHLPYCILLDFKIIPLKNISFGFGSVMETPDALRDVENYFNEIDRPHVQISLLSTQANSPTGKLKLASSTSFLFGEGFIETPKLIHEMWDNNMHLVRFTKLLQKDSVYHVGIVGSSVSSAHHPDPLNEAERLTIYAKLEGFQRLLSLHNAAWEKIWSSDIEIEGAPQVQQDIRNMMYHLYSFVRAGSSNSPSPMGLSGLGYNGHVFWDAELWMYPTLLMLHPELAKGMVDYRFNRIQQAQENAFAHGYSGAMFPWESAETGVEETPVWALSGAFEQHITGCVALAAYQYFAVTQDTLWLAEKGWKLIKESATFWASRVEKDDQGNYHIRNVVAADEWAENVDDNAFTNAIAKWNLKTANTVAEILHYPINELWNEIAQHISFQTLENGVTREHATYRGEDIKQADVNLLSYPLKEITDSITVRKNVEFYATRVPDVGTPAMTQAIFCILYCQLKEPDKALFFFKDSYEDNLVPPFRVLSETKKGTNPYFATGAGGILQAMLCGFGGLEISSNGIVLHPKILPPTWKNVRIKINGNYLN